LLIIQCFQGFVPKWYFWVYFSFNMLKIRYNRFLYGLVSHKLLIIKFFQVLPVNCPSGIFGTIRKQSIWNFWIFYPTCRINFFR